MPDFYDELAARDAELEAARAARRDDPEEWDRVKTAYAEWRRGIRLLGGVPYGTAAHPPDVVDFIANNPDDPRTVALKEG